MTTSCLYEHARPSNSHVFGRTMNEVLGAMRRADPLFDRAFRRVRFHAGTEAAGGGASAGNAIETHVLLQLPVKMARIQILKSKISKDLVHFKLTEPLGEASMTMKGRGHLLPLLLKLFDDRKQTFLSRHKVNHWVKEVLRKAEEELMCGQLSEPVMFSRRRVETDGEGVTVTSQLGREILRVNIILSIVAPPLYTKQAKNQPTAQTLHLFTEEPPASDHCDFSDQLFRAYDPKGKGRGGALALERTYKETKFLQKWSFIKAQYVKGIFIENINGSPSADEDPFTRDETFEKMLLNLFDQVDMFELFIDIIDVISATEFTCLEDVIRLAKDSPYSLARTILQNLRDKVGVSRRNV